MKSFITLCLSFFVCMGTIYGQTTLYSQNFNSGSASEWSLNTSDLGGVTTMTPNYWIINNVYAGDPPLIINTPNEPSGITGSPESYYMHITSALGAGLGAENCTYNASGTHSYFAYIDTSITTTGYSNVNISFWWICKGNANAFGQVYYRTSASGTWTQIGSTGTTPVALDSYNTQNTWQQVTGIHMAAFDNQPFLEFAFRFKHAASGSDPAFGLDDIVIVGTPSATAPVASFTTTATTACQDSCITFTSTSTGSPTSVLWSSVPTATIANPNNDTTSICFPTAGTYTVTLVASNSTGSTNATAVVNVTPTPSPTITQVGNVLSVPAVYTSYQWYNGTSIIPGATTNSYTITASGTYGIVVDSAGCPGVAVITGTLHVNVISNSPGHYWLTQPGSNSLNLNSSKPLNDALIITIYDATGRKILNETWDAQSNTKQINDFSGANGLYIIKLSNSYTSTILKWLKG